MSEEETEQEKQVTPKGAVEVDEEKLDQAAGGMSSGGDLPTESVSLNYSKIEFDYKPATKDPALSDASIAEKKI